jgi:fucose 4-O-acetylase-like acetyltransferase
MNNILWIDVLKGIGIVCVVAGHIYIEDLSKYIYTLFKELGMASMVVMYLHQSIQISLNILHWNQELRFIMALVCSYLVYLFFNKYTFTRKYFLGNLPILQIIK